MRVFLSTLGSVPIGVPAAAVTRAGARQRLRIAFAIALRSGTLGCRLKKLACRARFHFLLDSTPSNSTGCRDVGLSTPFDRLHSSRPTEKRGMKNIFVGNISFQTTEDQLRSLFESFGEVSRVNVVSDRDTGRPRGFAFVEMANDEEAVKAIDGTNGKDLDGRTLTVNEAKPKSPRPGGGGGGGFRDYSRKRREPRW